MIRRLAALFVLGVFACGPRPGEHIDDRTTAPSLRANALEVVASLPQPPGNVTVAPDGRLFFTYHSVAKPRQHVMEWKDGRAVPYPDERAQSKLWRTPLSLRIDRQGRLWVLDDGGHGFRRPQLIAFDLASDKIVHHKRFKKREAGTGSMLNDFQVDPAGHTIYIADTSFVARKPAIVVYDVRAQEVRRVLQRHPTVQDGEYRVYVDGRRIEVAGSPLWFGVDSIALDREGTWLYYAAVNGGTLFRVKTEDLRDESLSDADLGKRIRRFAPITLSDGLSTDSAGGIYVTDMEHSAIVRVAPDGRLQTLVKDPERLRWPDGLSFGPDGYLYVSASALHIYLGNGPVRRNVRRGAPYHILRFRPGYEAPAGH